MIYRMKKGGRCFSEGLDAGRIVKRPEAPAPSRGARGENGKAFASFLRLHISGTRKVEKPPPTFASDRLAMQNLSGECLSL